MGVLMMFLAGVLTGLLVVMLAVAGPAWVLVFVQPLAGREGDRVILQAYCIASMA